MTTKMIEQLAKEDDIEAVKWFRIRAGKGDVGAQYTLARMYTRGHGVQIDYKEALKWYQMAAENPDSDDHTRRDCKDMIIRCNARVNMEEELERTRQERQETLARLGEEFAKIGRG